VLHEPQWLACVRESAAMSTPFEHEPALLHSRSLVVVGAAEVYWSELHTECVAQARSTVPLPADFSYSSPEHSFHFVHAVPDRK